MKKIFIYGITVLVSASIPIYFLLIWEPLKAKDVIGNDISYNNLNKENQSQGDIYEELSINDIEIYKESIFNTFDNISLQKREKLNQLIGNLAIEDIIKINNYFKDLTNKDNIKKGVELIRKRVTQENFNEFKNIMKDYINFESENI